MKRAVSISLGSSKRDKKVVVNFKGEQIQVERVGMDVEKIDDHIKLLLVIAPNVRKAREQAFKES